MAKLEIAKGFFDLPSALPFLEDKILLGRMKCLSRMLGCFFVSAAVMGNVVVYATDNGAIALNIPTTGFRQYSSTLFQTIPVSLREAVEDRAVDI